jgi:hypothetical protein
MKTFKQFKSTKALRNFIDKRKMTPRQKARLNERGLK